MQLFSNISSHAEVEGKKVITVCESKVTAFLSYLAGFLVFAAVGAITILVLVGMFPPPTLFSALPPLLLGFILIRSAKKRTAQGGHFVIDGDRKKIIQKQKKITREWDFDDVVTIDKVLNISDGMRPPHFVFWLRATMSNHTTLNLAKGIESEVVSLQEVLEKIGVHEKK